MTIVEKKLIKPHHITLIKKITKLTSMSRHFLVGQLTVNFKSIGIFKICKIIELFKKWFRLKEVCTVIPAGWIVVPSLAAVHLNPENYVDPLAFNPWRWEVR